MKIREYILDTLYRVFCEDGYASLIMRENQDVDKTDMAYISECVYGTIRNYALLEYQWRPFAKKVRPKTALLLDMSVYQLFFMRTPDYAVINEAGRLARKADVGFVNAVLHKVLAKGFQKPDDPSVLYSHPKWILNLWKAHYGEEQALAIAQADQERPQVFGRINPLKITMEELEKESYIHRVDNWLFHSDIPLQKTEYFKDGKVIIQNPSSLKTALFLEAEEGMDVLDVCAAPGSKTQAIAAMMHNKGSIVACDLYEHRTELIQQLMNRTGVIICKTEVRDACQKNNFMEEQYDRVLCDVPCSGLGDLSHKPEIRWHLKPENLDSLMVIQRQILENAANVLKIGGKLVYSTCTLNKKENENQIHSFLQNHLDFEIEEEKTIFPMNGNDGFYMARLRKKEVL